MDFNGEGEEMFFFSLSLAVLLDIRDDIDWMLDRKYFFSVASCSYFAFKHAVCGCLEKVTFNVCVFVCVCVCVCVCLGGVCVC